MFLDDIPFECEGEDHLPCECRSHPFFGGWSSAVDIAPCCGLDGLGIRSHWQDFVHISRPLLRPIQPPVQWVPGFFPGVKGPWCVIDHLPHLAQVLKKKWTYTCAFSLGLHGLLEDELNLFISVFNFSLCLLLHLPLFMWVVDVGNSDTCPRYNIIIKCKSLVTVGIIYTLHLRLLCKAL